MKLSDIYEKSAYIATGNSEDLDDNLTTFEVIGENEEEAYSVVITKDGKVDSVNPEPNADREAIIKPALDLFKKRGRGSYTDLPASQNVGNIKPAK